VSDEQKEWTALRSGCGDSTGSWGGVETGLCNNAFDCTHFSSGPQPTFDSISHHMDRLEGGIRKQSASVMLQRWLLETDSPHRWLDYDQEIPPHADNVDTLQPPSPHHSSYFRTVTDSSPTNSCLTLVDTSTSNGEGNVGPHLIDIEVAHADPFCLSEQSAPLAGDCDSTP
jgi:hypothetical protein